MHKNLFVRKSMLVELLEINKNINPFDVMVFAGEGSSVSYDANRIVVKQGDAEVPVAYGDFLAKDANAKVFCITQEAVNADYISVRGAQTKDSTVNKDVAIVQWDGVDITPFLTLADVKTLPFRSGSSLIATIRGVSYQLNKGDYMCVSTDRRRVLVTHQPPTSFDVAHVQGNISL